MQRFLIKDDRWLELKEKLKAAGFYNCLGLRATIEAILFRFRAGVGWRDLPENIFPNWQAVYRFFNRNSKNGKIAKLFELLKPEIDDLRGAVDATIVKVHQHGTGARKGAETAIGKTAGGKTTKIHTVVDRWQNLDSFKITAGSAHEAPVFEEMIDSKEVRPYRYILGDKAYHSQSIRSKLLSQGTMPCIPSKSNSVEKDPNFSAKRYRKRHVVENLYCRIKHFRGIATRYDKLAITYTGGFYMTFIAVFMGLKLTS